MNIYEKILNDEEIIEIYNKVNELEDIQEAWAHHDLNHVTNVAQIIEKVLTKFNYPEEFIEEAKIAGLLHDVGMTEGKINHEIRAHEFAKEYFKRKNIKLKNEEKVLEAIIKHRDGFDTDNIIALALILGDKLDIKYTRIAKAGLNIEGMRQIQYIKDIQIDIVNNTLVITFKCDNKFNKEELDNYYFMKKVVKAIQSFSEKMTLQYKINYSFN